MTLVLFPRRLSQTLLLLRASAAVSGFHHARIRDIVSTLDQAALQIPNVGAFVGQRHTPEHGPATTYS